VLVVNSECTITLISRLAGRCLGIFDRECGDDLRRDLIHRS
jgi:hypothetical protein